MNILFVCKYNRFRSKVAEEIFNKLDKNEKIKAESAGIIIDSKRPYIEKNVIDIMEEKGYNIKGKSQKINPNFIKKSDLIIIAANDVNKKDLPTTNAKIIKWNIPDCYAYDIPSIKKIINQIEKKVKGLILEEI